MSLKLKNGLIKAFSHILSITGMIIVVYMQYLRKTNPMPTWSKILVPVLIALLIVFLIYYKPLSQKINRKLTAIETAKELGQTGTTNVIYANLLETIGIIIPLILIGAIFVIGGEFLVGTGIVLFEMLGLFLIIVFGNVMCDFNTREDIKKKTAEKEEALANKIAEKIEKIPNKYE